MSEFDDPLRGLDYDPLNKQRIRIMFWGPDNQPVLYANATDELPMAIVRMACEALESGERMHQQKGHAKCRICGTQLGSADMTDGTFVWPEGAEHYVKEHGVWTDGLDQLVIHTLNEVAIDNIHVFGDRTSRIHNLIAEEKPSSGFLKGIGRIAGKGGASFATSIAAGLIAGPAAGAAVWLGVLAYATMAGRKAKKEGWDFKDSVKSGSWAVDPILGPVAMAAGYALSKKPNSIAEMAKAVANPSDKTKELAATVGIDEKDFAKVSKKADGVAKKIESGEWKEKEGGLDKMAAKMDKDVGSSSSKETDGGDKEDGDSPCARAGGKMVFGRCIKDGKVIKVEELSRAARISVVVEQSKLKALARNSASVNLAGPLAESLFGPIGKWATAIGTGIYTYLLGRKAAKGSKTFSDVHKSTEWWAASGNSPFGTLGMAIGFHTTKPAKSGTEVVDQIANPSKEAEDTALANGLSAESIASTKVKATEASNKIASGEWKEKAGAFNTVASEVIGKEIEAKSSNGAKADKGGSSKCAQMGGKMVFGRCIKNGKVIKVEGMMDREDRINAIVEACKKGKGKKAKRLKTKKPVMSGMDTDDGIEDIDAIDEACGKKHGKPKKRLKAKAKPK